MYVPVGLKTQALAQKGLSSLAVSRIVLESGPWLQRILECDAGGDSGVVSWPSRSEVGGHGKLQGPGGRGAAELGLSGRG